MFVHVLLFVVVGLISKYTQLVQFLYLSFAVHIYQVFMTLVILSDIATDGNIFALQYFKYVFV